MDEMTIGKQLFCSFSEDFQFRPRKRGRHKTNWRNNKPEGCLWTSSLIGKDESEWVYLSKQNSLMEDRIGPYRYALTPKKAVKLYGIDSANDFDDMMFNIRKDAHEKLYQEESLGNVPISYTLFTSTIDFAWYRKQGYDGIHVTTRGYEENKDRYDLGFLGLNPPNLGSWDCESTVWFHYDWIESVERVDTYNPSNIAWFYRMFYITIRKGEDTSSEWFDEIIHRYMKFADRIAKAGSEIGAIGTSFTHLLLPYEPHCLKLIAFVAYEERDDDKASEYMMQKADFLSLLETEMESFGEEQELDFPVVVIFGEDSYSNSEMENTHPFLRKLFILAKNIAIEHKVNTMSLRIIANRRSLELPLDPVCQQIDDWFAMLKKEEERRGH